MTTDGRVFLLQIRQLLDKTHSVLYVPGEYENVIETLLDNTRSLFSARNGGGCPLLLSNIADWNPAEMIGKVPGKLALSLYQELITNQVWSQARRQMGYRDLTDHPLLIALAGHAYIDVRASMSSFLPAGLSDQHAAEVLAAYARRLQSAPHLHDKIEFAVVLSCLDCGTRAICPLIAAALRYTTVGCWRANAASARLPCPGALTAEEFCSSETSRCRRRILTRITTTA